MELPTNMTSLTSLLSQLGHKRVAQLVMALLLVYIAYVGAKITWSVVPQAQSSHGAFVNPNSKSLNSKQSHKTVDVAKIQSLNLFGQYNESISEEPDVQISNVPETKLNLILSGLVASDDKSIAAAIIEYQGKQETYGVGDIIMGTRANLEQVLIDRVLIKQSGRLETLMLDGFDYNQPVHNVSNNTINRKPKAIVNRPSPRSWSVNQRDNNQLRVMAKKLQNEISQDPTKIGDYFRISLKRINGKISGYTLSPGKKPEFFKLAGLKAGDVAVEMNGFDLIAPAQAMQAMAELKQARDVSLVVDRQGNLIEILISLD